VFCFIRLGSHNDGKIFSASASCSKFLNDKKYFNPVKNFWANSVVRTSVSCSKFLNNKKYLQWFGFSNLRIFGPGSGFKNLQLERSPCNGRGLEMWLRLPLVSSSIPLSELEKAEVVNSVFLRKFSTVWKFYVGRP